MRQTKWKSFLACTAVVYLSIQEAASLRLLRRMYREAKYTKLLDDNFFASGATASQDLVPHRSDSSIIMNPIQNNKLLAPDALHGINPNYGDILDVLSHKVETQVQYESTQTVRKHKGLFGSSIVHETREIMRPKATMHTTFVTTEGVGEFKQEMHGVNPFETSDGQPLALDEIKKTSKFQTKITLGDLRAKRNIGPDFLKYIEYPEKDEANNPNPEENIKLPAGHLYKKLAQYRLENLNAAGDGTQPLKLTDEEVDRAAAAMLEQDIQPLHLLKPENTHPGQVMTFKEFKIFLKYRMGWEPEDIKKFSSWITERHYSSLGTISDDEMFYMAHLCHNFIDYARTHDSLQKEKLATFLATQTQNQLVHKMVSTYAPHFNELLESRLSPTQAKYFRAYCSDVEGKEIVSPSLFDQEYEKWEKFPKPLSYRVERILELIRFKMIELPKLVWSKISHHGQALGSIVKEKWANLSQKSKKAVKKE